MMRRNVTAKTVAAGLVLVLYLAHAPTWAGSRTASLSGHVLSADSHLPLAGVRVHVGDPRTGAVHSSAATALDGSFSVAGLPPSTYEVAVQSDQGLYVVNGPIHLTPGEARRVQVGVRKDISPSPAGSAKTRRKGATNWWNNPLTATAIVVGAAVFIGVLVDHASKDQTTGASPSLP